MQVMLTLLECLRPYAVDAVNLSSQASGDRMHAGWNQNELQI